MSDKPNKTSGMSSFAFLIFQMKTMEQKAKKILWSDQTTEQFRKPNTLVFL
jgi:hypothetical protein